jgi:signal transduction histidine kinase
MLDDTLKAELDYFRLRDGNSSILKPFTSRTIAIHVATAHQDDHVPAYLRRLTDGSHEITKDDRNYRVLVEVRDEKRYYIQLDDTDVRRREQQFVRWVWTISVAVLILAYFIGWAISRWVSAPLDQLSNDVVSLEANPDQNIDLSKFESNEIGFLANRIHHYHDQLNQLLVREREFAGNVSHELRTPITNISLAAEVLATNPHLADKERARVHRIQRGAQEMSELVETFLVLSRAQDVNLDMYSACSVNEVTKDVIEQQNVWLLGKPVEVVVDDGAELEVAAPRRVVAVLLANLLRNAFRYTERGSVKITIDDGRITIEDTGPGIDAKVLGKLFEPHVRGVVADPDGFGLGLAIVKRICERYRWQVSAETGIDRGSRFEVRFEL